MMPLESFATAAQLGLMEGFPPPPEKRVDRSNALMAPPFNRWSYQNMRTIYPSAPVRSAAEPIPIGIELDGGINELDVAREDGTKVDFATFLREGYVDAMVVVTGDGIVCEEYLNGMSPYQPHQMMSVTKSFAGLFGLVAAADGLLSEEDPVTKFVPELASASAFSDATFGQVMDMTNSMEFLEDYADETSGIVRYGRVLGWLQAKSDEIPADNLYDYLVTLTKDPSKDHGEIFHYQTPKTDVVNWVTNRVTGKSFQDNMHEVLWSKLGTQGETYVLLDRNGTLVAGGGLNAGPRDLAAFALMMLNEGRFGGRQVVAAEVIDQLAAGANRAAFSAGPEAEGVMGGGDWSYRAQWWVRHTPGREAFTAIGIHGQWIYIDRDRGVGIVVQSSQPVSKDNYYDETMINAFDAIIEYLT